MSAFGDAFKAARAAGKKTFRHNGKLYTTQTKEEAAKASAKPAPKPAQKSKGPDVQAPPAPASSKRPPKAAPSKTVNKEIAKSGPDKLKPLGDREYRKAAGLRTSKIGRALDRVKIAAKNSTRNR